MKHEMIELEQVTTSILQNDALRLGVTYNPESGVCSTELLERSPEIEGQTVRLWCLEPKTHERISICNLSKTDRAEVKLSDRVKTALLKGILAVTCDRSGTTKDSRSIENYLATGTISVC